MALKINNSCVLCNALVRESLLNNGKFEFTTLSTCGLILPETCNRNSDFFQFILQIDRKMRPNALQLLSIVKDEIVIRLANKSSVNDFLADCFMSVQPKYMGWVQNDSGDSMTFMKHIENRTLSKAEELEEILVDQALNFLVRLYGLPSMGLDITCFDTLIMEKVMLLAYMGCKKQRAAALNVLQLAIKNDIGIRIKSLDRELWEKYKITLQNVYCKRMLLLVNSSDPDWAPLWENTITLIGTDLHRGSSLVNSLLKIVEIAFKSDDLKRKQAFSSWKLLIDNFALDQYKIAHTHHMKLLCAPLNAITSKNEIMVLIKMEVWWHLICKVYANIDECMDIVLIPFLNVCFGPFGNKSLFTQKSDSDISLGKKSCKTQLFAIKALMQLVVDRDVEPKACLSITQEKLPSPVSSVVFESKHKIFIRCFGKMLFNLSLMPDDKIQNKATIPVIIWDSLIARIEEYDKMKIPMYKEIAHVIVELIKNNYRTMTFIKNFISDAKIRKVIAGSEIELQSIGKSIENIQVCQSTAEIVKDILVKTVDQVAYHENASLSGLKKTTGNKESGKKTNVIDVEPDLQGNVVLYTNVKLKVNQLLVETNDILKKEYNEVPDIVKLHFVVQHGNKKEILTLLQEKVANFKETNENGDTLLHLIFHNQNLVEKEIIEVFKAFLAQEFDVNIKNKKELTVLHLAVASRSRNIVDLLIKANANILMRDKKHNSIAHYFIEDEKLKFFQRLKHGNDIIAEKSHKFEEMEKGSVGFVEWLISRGFDFSSKNLEGKSALDLSIEFNLQHIVLLLLKEISHVHSVDKDNKTLLHLFFEANIRYRIENSNGSDGIKNNWNSCGSRYAIKIVKCLLDKGVSAVAFDYQGQTPLYMAIHGKEEENIIETLITHLVEASSQKQATFALMELLKSCDCWSGSKVEYFLNILDSLIAKGASVNCKDIIGRTPVYFAFQRKNLSAVHYLNDHHANFRMITDSGENLLHALATEEPNEVDAESNNDKFESLFKVLAIKNCCDVNARAYNNETPLHIASRYENCTIVRKLIECGAQINCENVSRQTPLHLAAYYNFSDTIVKCLIENGVDVNAQDSSGNQALYYALVPRRAQMVSLLLEAGAFVDAKIFWKTINFQRYPEAEKMLMYGSEINRFINLLPESKLNGNLRNTKFILQHWIKLKAANLPCSEKFAAFVGDEKYQRFYQDCFAEIKDLKKIFIDCQISVYNFLHTDLSSRRKYLNNNNLINFVNGLDIKKRFPQYFPLIVGSYRETLRWKALLEPAKRVWFLLTNIALPDICIEQIFGYLGNEDLVNMIQRDEKKNLL